MLKLIILIFIILIIKFTYKTEHFYNLSNYHSIYVVNLESDINRWDQILNDAKKQNLNIKRFNAVDGRKINLNHPSITNIFKSRKLKPGQKGCALSHINLWKQISNGNPDDNIIILEDDAIIPKDFDNKLKLYLNQAPNNWDMIILGGNRFKGTHYSNNLIKPVINKYGNWGTFGYMIKRKCAKKLLKNCSILNTTIDHHLNLNFYSQHNVFFCVPQLVTHDYNYYSNILHKVRKDDSERNNKVEIIKN
jgi:GR25 family glycosyltransferase involved in LPS biosynthesis